MGGIRILSWCLAVWVWCQPASAAEFAVVGQTRRIDYDNPQCTIRMSGEILLGDLDKMKEAIEKAEASLGDRKWGGWEAYGVLCLNSLGGNYVEALKMAGLLLDQNITTKVESGARCFSACAIVFMAGKYTDHGWHPSRHLDVGGVLGFHAPYARLADGTYDKAGMETMYQSGIRAIRDLMKLGRQHHASRDFLPISLVIELLDKGPNEAFLIDTVYKAVHAHIELDSARQPSITIAGLGNICETLFAKARIDHSLNDAPDAWGGQFAKVTRKGDQLWFRNFYGPEASGFCVVSISSTDTAKAPFHVAPYVVYTDGPKLGRWEFSFWGRYWHVYPPATPISSLR